MRIRSIRLGQLAAFVIASLVVAFGLIVPAQAATASAWYQGGYNQSESGYNPNETTLVYGHLSTLHQVWHKSTAEPCCVAAAAQVVSANGLSYYYSPEDTVYAVHTSTGAAAWSAQVGHCVDSGSPPSIHLGVLLVPTSECSPDDYNGGLSAYNATTGVRLWTFSVVNGAGPPVTVNGYAYVVSQDDNGARIDALNVKTGAVRWELHPSYYPGQLASDGTKVYVTTGNALIALTATNGHTAWTRSAPASSVLLSNGHVVTAGYGGSDRVVTSFSTTGTQQWQKHVAGSQYFWPAATPSTIVLAGGNTVSALALSNGAPQWAKTVSGQVYTQPAIAGGVVYICGSTSSNSPVTALHITDGSRQWSHSFPATDAISASIAAGTLFISLDNYGVYALRP